MSNTKIFFSVNDFVSVVAMMASGMTPILPRGTLDLRKRSDGFAIVLRRPEDGGDIAALVFDLRPSLVEQDGVFFFRPRATITSSICGEDFDNAIDALVALRTISNAIMNVVGSWKVVA